MSSVEAASPRRDFSAWIARDAHLRAGEMLEHDPPHAIVLGAENGAVLERASIKIVEEGIACERQTFLVHRDDDVVRAAFNIDELQNVAGAKQHRTARCTAHQVLDDRPALTDHDRHAAREQSFGDERTGLKIAGFQLAQYLSDAGRGGGGRIHKRR